MADANIIRVGGAIYTPDSKGEVACIARLEDKAATEFTIASSVQDSKGKTLPVVEIGDQAFAGLGVKKVIVPACIEVIQKGAFFKCASLETVEFEGDSALNFIDDGAFLESGLESFVLPKKCQKMGIWAFKQCERLTRFGFAEGCVLEEIPEAAFQSCTALEDFIVPPSVKKIDKFAFEKCTKLKNFNFAPGSQLEEIIGACFRETAIEEFTVPTTVTNLGAMTFDNLKSLTKININPETQLKTIPPACFHGCPIEEITIPASVKEILEFAFAECDKLVRVNICEGSLLQRIAYGAFAVTAIESFEVGPNFRAELEGKAFWKCTNLTTFKCAKGGRVPAIQEDAFKETKLAHLEAPGCLWFGKECLAGTKDTLTFVRLTDEDGQGDKREIPVRFAPDCGLDISKGFFAYSAPSLKVERAEISPDAFEVA